MRYFGGKAKIAKPLAQYLNSRLQEAQPFVDLFCGSCNVVSKVDGNRVRVANDLHYELVALHKAVQDGSYSPYRITEEEYNHVKNNREGYEPWFVAFVGFGLSFSGKYFGGFARDNRGDDYFANCVSSTLKKHKTLTDVTFRTGSYNSCPLPEGALVYCDIPYKNTTKYSTGSFNHEDFYQWAVRTQSDGHTVLVSEYKHNLPSGWEIVWEHASKKDIRNSSGEQEPTIEILMRPKQKELANDAEQC